MGKKKETNQKAIRKFLLHGRTIFSCHTFLLLTRNSVDMSFIVISLLLHGTHNGQETEPSVLFSTLLGKLEILRGSQPASGRRKGAESTQPLAGPVPLYAAV